MSTQTSTLLSRISAFADQLDKAEHLADRDSLTAAADLTALYERRDWVEEWLEEAPIKPKTFYIGGRPPAPDSRHRFTSWLAWRLEMAGHRKIVSRRCYQLMNAHEVRGYLHAVQITPSSEWQIRPLDWFRKHKLERFIPEVWARAVELADGGEPTVMHVKVAVTEWKRANHGEVLVTTQSSRAQRDRIKAQTAVSVLISHADHKELLRFNNWISDTLDKAFEQFEKSSE